MDNYISGIISGFTEWVRSGIISVARSQMYPDMVPNRRIITAPHIFPGERNYMFPEAAPCVCNGRRTLIPDRYPVARNDMSPVAYPPIWHRWNKWVPEVLLGVRSDTSLDTVPCVCNWRRITTPDTCPVSGNDMSQAYPSIWHGWKEWFSEIFLVTQNELFPETFPSAIDRTRELRMDICYCLKWTEDVSSYMTEYMFCNLDLNGILSIHDEFHKMECWWCYWYKT